MGRHVGAAGRPSPASVDNANNGIDRTDVAFRGVRTRTERSINFPAIHNSERCRFCHTFGVRLLSRTAIRFHRRCVSSDGRGHYSIVHEYVETCTTPPLYCEYFVQCSRNAKRLFNNFNNWTQREWRTSSKPNRLL